MNEASTPYAGARGPGRGVGYEDGADVGGDGGVLPEADPDPAEADDEPVFAGADEDVDADEDADADAEAVADVDVDVVGVGVGVGDADVVGVGDVVGAVEVAVVAGCVAGDEYVLAGCDVPEYGDELTDDDGEAVGVVGVVDADEVSGATVAGVVAGDVCAAGDSI